MVSSDERSNILFKRFLGKSSTADSRAFFEEPINSRNAVYTAQIWAQSDQIPSTAPTLAPDAVSGVVQFKSGLTLSAVAGTSNGSFYHADLQDAIPFNFGDGSYNYQVTDNLGASIAFGEGDWVLDPEGGVLTFYDGFPSGKTPPAKISFYRYVGSKGLTASGSIMGFAEVGSGAFFPTLSSAYNSGHRHFAVVGNIVEGSITFSDPVYIMGSKNYNIVSNNAPITFGLGSSGSVIMGITVGLASGGYGIQINSDNCEVNNCMFDLSGSNTALLVAGNGNFIKNIDEVNSIGTILEVTGNRNICEDIKCALATQAHPTKIDLSGDYNIFKDLYVTGTIKVSGEYSSFKQLEIEVGTFGQDGFDINSSHGYVEDLTCVPKASVAGGSHVGAFNTASIEDWKFFNCKFIGTSYDNTGLNAQGGFNIAATPISNLEFDSIEMEYLQFLVSYDTVGDTNNIEEITIKNVLIDNCSRSVFPSYAGSDSGVLASFVNDDSNILRNLKIENIRTKGDWGSSANKLTRVLLQGGDPAFTHEGIQIRDIYASINGVTSGAAIEILGGDNFSLTDSFFFNAPLVFRNSDPIRNLNIANIQLDTVHIGFALTGANPFTITNITSANKGWADFEFNTCLRGTISNVTTWDLSDHPIAVGNANNQFLAFSNFSIDGPVAPTYTLFNFAGNNNCSLTGILYKNGYNLNQGAAWNVGSNWNV